MILTVTKIYLPDHPWNPTRTGLGVDKDGVTHTFEGRTPQMETLRERIEEEGEVETDVADQNILASITPGEEGLVY